MPAPNPRTLLLIDDDELVRELLTLLATEAGFDVQAFDSGQAALEHIAHAQAAPGTVLTDLQMPGLFGDTLARLLRTACPGTTLLAMSGSEPKPATIAAFDGFLLKPFDIDDLEAAIAGASTPQPVVSSSHPILNQSIFAGLAKSMPAAQLRELYLLCLADAERRLATMRLAAAAGDAESFERAAHAVKGGCGMVGASELAGLAAQMETGGPPPVGDQAPFEEFLASLARLRRILDAKTSNAT